MATAKPQPRPTKPKGPPFDANGMRPSGPMPTPSFPGNGGANPASRPMPTPGNAAPAKPRPKPSGPATGQARPLTNMTEMLPARSAGTAKPAGTASTTKKVKSFMKKYGQA